MSPPNPPNPRKDPPEPRALQIETPLGDDKLLLRALDGREGISELFHFRLQLVAEAAPGSPPIAFQQILGKPVTVRFNADFLGASRTIHGIVSAFSEAEHDEGLIHYEAEVVPRFWLLKHQVRSRIFQWTRVPDILKQVLAPLRPDLELRLTGTYPERAYCVQYQESDYAFACRLMEEEGIYFFFTHAANKHVLVLSDNGQASVDLPERPLIEMGRLRTPEVQLRIVRWKKTQRIVAPKYTVRDYHFLAVDKPTPLESTIPLAAPATFGTVEHSLPVTGTDELEVVDYPAGFARHYDAVGFNNKDDKSSAFGQVFKAHAGLVRLRGEEQTNAAFVVEGESNCPHLVPGFKFRLAKHANANGPYLITWVRHRAAARALGPGPAGACDYSNEFGCLPTSVQFRPRRITPKPSIVGLQTAVVVTDGGEVTIDKYARVKVKFHWDRRRQADLSCSCWVRVAQIWAGKKWGAFFWPRQGHEVVVGFCDGDPDQPLIVGSVYNAVNLPPTDPVSEHDHYKIAGIRTKIFGVDSEKASNGIVFYDAKDDEYTQIYSQKNDVQSARGNRFEYVPVNSVEFTGRFPTP